MMRKETWSCRTRDLYNPSALIVGGLETGGHGVVGCYSPLGKATADRRERPVSIGRQHAFHATLSRKSSGPAAGGSLAV